MAVLASVTFVASTSDDFDPNDFNGQSFTITAGSSGDPFTATTLKVRMSSTSTHSGTVNLYASDGSGEPTGASLASMSFTSVNFGSEAPYTFTFTTAAEAALVSASAYVFVVRADTPSNDLKIHASLVSELAGHDKIDSTDGITWGHTVSSDVYFELNGDATTVSVYVPSDVRYTRELVTFSANRVFHGSTPAAMTELTAARDEINTGNSLQATEAYGKVFVANETNLKVADFVNIKLNTTSLGSNVPDRTNILTGGTSAAQMAVDYIDASSGDTNLYGNLLTTATFTSGETVTGTNDAGNAVSFVLSANQTAAPHWYDWTVYANDITTYGTLPTTADIIELHIGCVWLMGDSRYPHQWYKSRQNNPWDYIYAQNDAGSAVAGNDTDAGEVGDIIVDAISYSDDYMVVAGSSELHVISGNPAAGGRIDLLRNTGLVAARAWTWDDEGNLYLLSTEGLLMIPKGFGTALNITKGVYPDFIEDLAYDPTLHRMTMGYDSIRFGILISRTLASDGTNECWWYDTRTGGLSREVYPTAAGFFSMWKFVADDPANSALLFGSFDGHIREHLNSAKSDDQGATDAAIDSYVTFGPIATSNTVRKAGRVSNGDLTAGGADDGATDDSNDVTVETYDAENPSDLIKKLVAGTAPKYSKIYKASGHKKGNVDRRKTRARWVGYKLGNNTAGESFSLEKFNVEGI